MGERDSARRRSVRIYALLVRGLAVTERLSRGTPDP
jgi:hypothetical protein